MSSALRIGLGFLVVPVVAYGVYRMFSYPAPQSSLLAQDEISSYQENSFGKKYGKYFVSAHPKDNPLANKSWWEWSYYQLQKNGVSNSSLFSPDKVSSAFSEENSSDSPKSLNMVCKKIYESTELYNSKKVEAEEVWKYCSVFGGKPKAITESAENFVYELTKHEDSDFFGHKLKEKVVSGWSENKENDLFWKMKEDEFFKMETLGDDAKKMFKKLFAKKSKVWFYGGLRDTCLESYFKTSSNSEDVTEAEILKWCTLEGS